MAIRRPLSCQLLSRRGFKARLTGGLHRQFPGKALSRWPFFSEGFPNDYSSRSTPCLILIFTPIIQRLGTISNPCVSRPPFASLTGTKLDGSRHAGDRKKNVGLGLVPSRGRSAGRPANPATHALAILHRSPISSLLRSKGMPRTPIQGRNPGGGVNVASETRTIPPTNTPNLILSCAGCDRHGRLGSTAPLPVSPAIHSSIGDPSRLRTLARIDKL